jgi:hypothetical protein
MQRFLKRLFVFLIPFSIYAIIVITIDPYNYFFRKNFITDKIKVHVINRNPKAMPRGNTLWKYIDFKRHPCKNIIIGDSRAYDLNVSVIKKITGQEYFNFGVPGGNYNSIFETFWYITSVIKPEKIYIQVSFHTYSKSSDYNLVADAKTVIAEPYLFFTRGYFFQEAILDVYYTFTGIPDRDMKKEAFNESRWNETLMKQGDNSLLKMVYPPDYYVELKKISAYCKNQNIELAFIIFPDQQDFHDLVLKHSLTNEYIQYKNDINSLGKLYDFDKPDSNLSRNRNNYRDIFHLNLDLINSDIIPVIWNESKL